MVCPEPFCIFLLWNEIKPTCYCWTLACAQLRELSILPSNSYSACGLRADAARFWASLSGLCLWNWIHTAAANLCESSDLRQTVTGNYHGFVIINPGLVSILNLRLHRRLLLEIVYSYLNLIYLYCPTRLVNAVLSQLRFNTVAVHAASQPVGVFFLI